MRCLLVVEATLAIHGRGLVLVPHVHALESRHQRFHVELRRPDGSRRTTEAQCHPISSSPAAPSNAAAVVLPDMAKADVPVGTEVWVEA
jgi:hypothetical protein